MGRAVAVWPFRLLGLWSHHAPVGYRDPQMTVTAAPARLTGAALLAHHRAFHFSKADKVREAGYIGQKPDGSERLYFVQYYEAVLPLIQHEKMLKNRDDRGGADCIRSVIFHAEQRVKYKKANDEVVYFPAQQVVLIRFHGQSICCIHYSHGGYVSLIDTRRSKSTKERLNRILMRFCGVRLYQHKGEWYVSHPMKGDIPFEHYLKVPFVPTLSEILAQ